MSPTSLYHLRHGSKLHYKITKLNEDYDVEATYLVSEHECTCPAGPRPTCRHRQMLPFFLTKGHVDNGFMLDWATRQWRKPLCEDQRVTAIDEASESGDEGTYGIGPAMHALPDLRAWNALSPDERAHASARYMDAKLGAAIDDAGPASLASSSAGEVEQSSTQPTAPSPAVSLSAAIKRRKVV